MTEYQAVLAPEFPDWYIQCEPDEGGYIAERHYTNGVKVTTVAKTWDSLTRALILYKDRCRGCGGVVDPESGRTMCVRCGPEGAS